MMERSQNFKGFYVAIGGGTGMSYFLWHSPFPKEKTAVVVTPADDGGNTGTHREKNGSFAVGDIRQNLCPLASDVIQPEFTTISQWRVRGDYGRLNGMNMLDVLELGFKEISESSNYANIAFRRIYGYTPEEIRALVRYGYDLGTLGKLMEYNFPQVNDHNEIPLKDNCIGNLVLVALEKVYGGIEPAIEAARELYGVKAKILPSTLDKKAVLKVILSNGQTIIGEHNIGQQLHTYGEGISVRRVETETPVDLYEPVRPAILDAKVRIYVFGSPVTSTAAASTPIGFKDVWSEVRIDKNGETIMFGSAMTDKETRYMRKAWQQLEVIGQTMGNPAAVSRVFLNDPNCIPRNALDRYAEYEQYPVLPCPDVCAKIFPNARVEVVPMAVYIKETGHIRYSPRILGEVLAPFV